MTHGPTSQRETHLPSRASSRFRQDGKRDDARDGQGSGDVLNGGRRLGQARTTALLVKYIRR